MGIFPVDQFFQLLNFIKELFMDCVFCTLFDSNYLDKGLTLYKSMERHIPEFKLYVFAFDDKCYEILKNENYPGLIPISLEEFETPELLKVKSERTRAEYCWTCSPWIIKHVLDHFHEKICTYIDADMEFFSSPQPVFDEMRKRNCSTIIVPHRYETEEEDKKQHELRGSYCVEFNTFVNDENGYKTLSWWADRCLEWCYYSIPGTTEWYGDQKYLNAFSEKFDGVMVCDHYGVGVAPWNMLLFDYAGTENDTPLVRVKKTGQVFPLVIYHFESVSFLTTHILCAPSDTDSRELYKAVYDSYISRLMENRYSIEKKYGIRLSRKKRVVTKNPLLILYHKYIAPIRRMKHFYFLYRVK